MTECRAGISRVLRGKPEKKKKKKKKALHRKGAAMGGNHVQRVKVETGNAKP